MKGSMDQPSHVTLGRRYKLQEALGRGGMGVVYRAEDLLTGNQVALKQVTVPTDQIMFASRSDDASFDLALAQEFRALATIRHPHIISVYDFGFGRERQPYYTMEYLDGGRTILDSGQDLPDEGKAELILQMLQALVYLHRRGILHRDLKPTNALVLDGRLKLLDFGLSVITGRTVEHMTRTMSGTVAYLAPEIFQGEPYSRASDLYAVGLIAFQLFSGQFPYNESNLATLLHDIMSKAVDASAYGVGGRLAPVLNRMLAKTREERYGDAGQAIGDLTSAVELPMPSETVEIRESFLQAAKFVGREEELSALSGYLNAAIDGRGTVVLIGGESGVGKSRLLDELRVRALVKGALVLQGQAISSGRSPYQLWLGVLRSLALFANPNDGEADALMTNVPDLGRLLNREGGEELLPNPQAAQKQWAGTISRLLGRLDQPAMIVLEDLQWAGDESIQLLGELLTSLADLPVLMAGTYRDDKPLPALEGLDPSAIISLGRLTEAEIAELCASILGRAGSGPALVSLLLEETEGNAFFLVEAVRTLAEEAGRLDRVRDMALPESFVVGGVRAILNRRLDRVPGSARPLMKLASVAGRQLDLRLLRALEPEADLEPWLAALADVAVIEAQGETWRFAHDKLREEIKESLSHEEHHTLHRRVAEALELVYPGDPEQAAILTHHWSVAGEPEKVLHYAEIAGRLAATRDAREVAIKFFERALELLKTRPESPERDGRELALLTDLGPQLTIARGFGSPVVERTFLRAQELSERIGSTGPLFRTIWGQFMHYYHVFEFNRADGLLRQLLRLARQSGEESLILAANHAGWTIEFVRGDLALAEDYIEQGLAGYDSDLYGDHSQLYGHDSGICALMMGSMNHWLMGYPDRARDRNAESQALAEKLDHTVEWVFAHLGSGFVAYQCGEYQNAVEHSSHMLSRLSEEFGSKLFEAFGMLFQGAALNGQGHVSQGLARTREALDKALLVRARAWLPFFLSGYLEACLAAGEIDEGLLAIQDELKKSGLTGQRVFESEIRRLHGDLILARDSGAAAEAEEQYQLALEIARRQEAKSLELRAVMSLARLWQKQGKADQARASLEESYNWFTEGFDTADLVAAKELLEELGARHF